MIDRRMLMVGMGAAGLVAAIGTAARAAHVEPGVLSPDGNDPKTAVMVFDDDALAEKARWHMARRGIRIVEEADLREVGLALASVAAADTVWIACTPDQTDAMTRVLRLADVAKLACPGAGRDGSARDGGPGRPLAFRPHRW